MKLCTLRKLEAKYDGPIPADEKPRRRVSPAKLDALEGLRLFAWQQLKEAGADAVAAHQELNRAPIGTKLARMAREDWKRSRRRIAFALANWKIARARHEFYLAEAQS